MEVIISHTVFQEFLAIFEPDSPQDMRPEEHLLAATSLLQKKEDTIANMQFEINQLKRMLFKSRGERFVPSTLQLTLPFEDQEVITVPEPVTEKVAYERVKKKHPGRSALPEHIPVEEIILEPEGLTPDMIHIGAEITETLDYKPPVLLKRRYIRRKYAVKNPVEDATGNIVIADLPLVRYPKPSQRPVCLLICGLQSLCITRLFTGKLRCSKGSLVGNRRIPDKSTER